MTHKVKKSALGDLSPEDFDARVRWHASELEHWHRHMQAVRDADERERRTGEVDSSPDRPQAYPAPADHDLVTNSIRREERPGGKIVVTVDYEIEDDSHDLLRKRKDELIADVTRIEIAAVAAIAPPGKRRLLEMQARDAHKRAELGDVSAEDDELMRTHESREIAVARVSRWAAEQQAAIEDLDAAGVEAWRPGEPPKAEG